MVSKILSYLREERAKDREALLEGLRLVVEQNNRQAEVALEQTRMFRQFFGQFMGPDGAPESRTVRDEDEFDAEMQRYQMYLHKGES